MPDYAIDMSESGRRSSVWRPRHRGWNLAHHLLPTFLLIVFLSGAGVYAFWHGRPALSTALLASALSLVLVVVSAFRRPTADTQVANAAVETSTGQRAATWFPIFGTSTILAALMVGLAVVVLVASIALSAKLLFMHDNVPIVIAAIAGALLIGCAIFLIARGIRMAKIAAVAQAPGVYLTRSRVVQYDSHGMAEIYWNEISAIEAADPPGRHPLGRRGPAWIRIERINQAQTEQSPKDVALLIQVHELSANPDLLLRTLAYYLQHPEARAQLGTDAAIDTLSALGGDD